MLGIVAKDPKFCLAALMVPARLITNHDRVHSWDWKNLRAEQADEVLEGICRSEGIAGCATDCVPAKKRLVEATETES